MVNIFMIFYMVEAAALILIVLFQKGSDGGIEMAYNSSQSRSNTSLKFTYIVGILFMFSTFILSYFSHL